MKRKCGKQLAQRPDPRRRGIFGTLRGYGRWLKVCLVWLRGRGGSLVLTRDEKQELLLAGFPGLLAVPAELFSALPETLLPPALPARGAGEDGAELIRALERRFDRGFDWDAFLTACERHNRRVQAALARLGRIPEGIDTGSAEAALAALFTRERKEEE